MDFDLSDAIAVQPAITYAHFRPDENALLTDAGVTGQGISIDGGASSGIFVAGNVKAKIPVQGSSVSPYFLAGIG